MLAEELRSRCVLCLNKAGSLLLIGIWRHLASSTKMVVEGGRDGMEDGRNNKVRGCRINIPYQY